MKVVVDNSILKFKELIPHLSDLKDIDFYHLHTEEIINNSIKDAEILFVRSTLKINADLINNTKIKFVGSATAGFDHIDVKYLENNNINWCYSPGCNSSSVVHYVISSINFLIEKKLFNLNDCVGIVGYGNIGSKLRKALNKVGIKNICYDPFLKLEHLKNFDEIKQCKLLSFHVPLTIGTAFPTKNIINESLIKDFKNKIIINTSRGDIADESSIIRDTNLIYISDVWQNEPSPFKEIINRSLLSTPHIAGYSYDGRINGTITLFKRLFQYLNFSHEKQKINTTIIKDFLNKKEINHYPQRISEFASAFDILKESKNFKRISKEYEKSLPANIYKKIRLEHPSRRDILPD